MRKENQDKRIELRRKIKDNPMKIDVSKRRQLSTIEERRLLTRKDSNSSKLVT